MKVVNFFESLDTYRVQNTPQQSSNAVKTPSQPELVVLLDKMSGENNANDVTKQYAAKSILNGANSQHNNILDSTSNNPTRIYTSGSKRCRSCLKMYTSSNCRNITGPCFMDKTIKEAIARLVPEIVSV